MNMFIVFLNDNAQRFACNEPSHLLYQELIILFVIVLIIKNSFNKTSKVIGVLSLITYCISWFCHRFVPQVNYGYIFLFSMFSLCLCSVSFLYFSLVTYIRSRKNKTTE
jgi:prolipoprotein diacylglyceryltransferase